MPCCYSIALPPLTCEHNVAVRSARAGMLVEVHQAHQGAVVRAMPINTGIFCMFGCGLFFSALSGQCERAFERSFELSQHESEIIGDPSLDAAVLKGEIKALLQQGKQTRLFSHVYERYECMQHVDAINV